LALLGGTFWKRTESKKRGNLREKAVHSNSAMAHDTTDWETRDRRSFSSHRREGTPGFFHLSGEGIGLRIRETKHERKDASGGRGRARTVRESSRRRNLLGEMEGPRRGCMATTRESGRWGERASRDEEKVYSSERGSPLKEFGTQKGNESGLVQGRVNSSSLSHQRHGQGKARVNRLNDSEKPPVKNGLGKWTKPYEKGRTMRRPLPCSEKVKSIDVGVPILGSPAAPGEKEVLVAQGCCPGRDRIGPRVKEVWEQRG